MPPGFHLARFTLPDPENFRGCVQVPQRMTISEARQVFASLMSTARTRPLTAHEKAELSYARQQLRADRKGARRNPRKSTTATESRYARLVRKLVRYRKEGGPPLTPAEVKQLAADTRVILKTVPTERNPLTRAKAKQILHEGRAQGRKLTEKQRRFFGARASGAPRRNPKQVIKAEHADVFVHNPGGLVRMGTLVELRYHRDHGRAKGYYRHPFKQRPTIYYRPSDNSILIKGGR